ncbi:Hemolysin III [uncultured virus]|nr:Hemolysin III [uncultured virus]
MESTNTEKEIRPYLKGVFHTLTFLIYLFWSPYLLESVPESIKMATLIYLLGVVGHLAASSLLHLIPWSLSFLPYVRKFDHSMIFVKIASVYYIAICTVMPDIDPKVLSIVIVGTILGILMRIFFTDIPRVLIGIPYVVIGWAFLLDFNIPLRLLTRVPIGTLIGVSAGICYTTGAVIYIKKYPNPYPRYLGFHEIFHFLSSIGAFLFTLAIFGHAIPYYQSTIQY